MAPIFCEETENELELIGVPWRDLLNQRHDMNQYIISQPTGQLFSTHHDPTFFRQPSPPKTSDSKDTENTWQTNSGTSFTSIQLASGINNLENSKIDERMSRRDEERFLQEAPRVFHHNHFDYLVGRYLVRPCGSAWYCHGYLKLSRECQK